jgi:hypothetical protein
VFYRLRPLSSLDGFDGQGEAERAVEMRKADDNMKVGVSECVRHARGRDSSLALRDGGEKGVIRSHQKDCEEIIEVRSAPYTIVP